MRTHKHPTPVFGAVFLFACFAQAQTPPQKNTPASPSSEVAPEKTQDPTKAEGKKSVDQIPAKKQASDKSEASESAADSVDKKLPSDLEENVHAKDAPLIDAEEGEEGEPSGSAIAPPFPEKEEADAEKPGAQSSDKAVAKSAGSTKKKGKKKPPSKPKAPPLDYSKLPQTYHLRHIDVAIGPRLSSATHDGLQPYMYEPLTGEVVGRLSAVVSASEPWASAVVLQASGFARSDMARNSPTELTVIQMGAGFEQRYHFHHRGFAYGRAVLGTELAQVAYGDSYSREAKSKTWAFFADAQLGAAVRVVGSSDGRKRRPRLWLFLEGGGRFASTHQVELDLENGPHRAESIKLPSFSTNGGMVSAGVMLSF